MSRFTSSGDVPRVISLRVRQDGGHCKVTVWIGQEGAPGHCGELTMRPEDFFDLRDALADGNRMPAHIGVRYEGVTHGWLDAIERLMEPPLPEGVEGYRLGGRW